MRSTEVTKPLTPEFKFLGQPVTSEVRSMTQKWPKCEFADNFASEQARAETRTFLTVVGILCDAFRPPTTCFWGSKFRKIFFVKIVIFLLGA